MSDPAPQGLVALDDVLTSGGVRVDEDVDDVGVLVGVDACVGRVFLGLPDPATLAKAASCGLSVRDSTALPAVSRV